MSGLRFISAPHRTAQARLINQRKDRIRELAAGCVCADNTMEQCAMQYAGIMITSRILAITSFQTRNQYRLSRNVATGILIAPDDDADTYRHGSCQTSYGLKLIHGEAHGFSFGTKFGAWSKQFMHDALVKMTQVVGSNDYKSWFPSVNRRSGNFTKVTKCRIAKNEITVLLFQPA